MALPGTCGELVQGTLDGEPCLISCPIDYYSIAEVRFQPWGSWTVPEHAPKTRAALRLAWPISDGRQAAGTCACRRNCRAGAGIGRAPRILAPLSVPSGRRQARDLSRAKCRTRCPRRPTDSSLFPGLALWDHRYGHVYEDLGAPPALAVVILDPGGVWIRWRSISLIIGRFGPAGSQHREAFALLREGLRQGNLEAIGAAATLVLPASTRPSWRIPYWNPPVASPRGQSLGCVSRS